MHEGNPGSGAKSYSKSEEFFNKIYQENIDKLLYFADKSLPTRQDSEDICNDVFAKIWEGRGRLSEIHDIDRFLFTSVKNAILNFLDKEKNLSEREKEWVERVRQASRPEEINDLRDSLKSRIFNEINNLPARCREVFELAYLEDLKNDQIAELLGITKGTVKAQKVKALRLLRLSKLSRDLLLNVTPYVLLMLHH